MTRGVLPCPPVIARVTVLGAALALMLPAGVMGQEPYRRTPGETLRYREITVDTSVTQFPGGELLFFLRTESALRITFRGGDSAEARYEALRVEMGSPQGSLAPAISPAEWAPFVLRVEGSGRVVVDSLPEVEAEVAQVFDPRFQFEDFLVTIPPGELVTGRRWADTVGSETTAQVGTWSRSQIIRRYQVVGDTIAPECRCTMIWTESDLTMEIRAPAAPSRHSETRYTGIESGMVLWDGTRGQMMTRGRTAQLTGTIRMDQGPITVTTEVRRRYHSSIVLVEPEG